jgi:NNP family nitrate/nitrite transporter-like MFS transporter
LLFVAWFLYPAYLSIAGFPLLIVLGTLSGWGSATFSVGINQVSYWFPQRQQGRALAIFAGVGNLAPGRFSLLLPLAKEISVRGRR